MTVEHFIHLANELCESHKYCGECPGKRLKPCPWNTLFITSEQEKLLKFKDILEDWDYERDKDD